MDKKFFIQWAVVFVAWFVGSFVVHGVLLHSGYSELQNLFRSEAESQELFHFMALAHLILSGAFVWIYQRGTNDSPWLGQGLRFGAAIALFGPISTYMIFYAVQPMPGSFVIMQMIYDGALTVVLGVLIAFLNRNASSS